MKARSADGTAVYFEQCGHGEPLVLIPGLGMSTRSFPDLLPPLTERFQTITMDPRGAGASDCPPGPYTGPMMASDVVAVLDAVGVEQAHVLGVSMGGMVAQHLAVNHPDRVRSLTLVSTYAAPDPWTRRVFDVRQSTLKDQGLPAQIRLAMLFLFSPDTFATQHELVDVMEGMYGAPGERDAVAYASQLEFCRTHDCGEALRNVDAPTLVVTGTHDLLIPATHGRELATTLPNATYVEIAGATHLLVAQAAIQLSELVTDFLAGLSSPPDADGALTEVKPK